MKAIRFRIGVFLGISSLRNELMIGADWREPDFNALRARLDRHSFRLDSEKIDYDGLKSFLTGKGTFLPQLLENPNLQEHEMFTDMLLALFHLQDELLARHTFQKLPGADLAHLAGDIKRAYVALAKVWGGHMYYLKTDYPYLFSLAARNNPFSETPSIYVV